MQGSFIIDAVRTPIGSFRGRLSGVRTDDLAAHVIRALLSKHPSFEGSLVDDVIMGCANQAGEDNRNVARMALLLAGLPHSVPGETVNRLCASGMSAVVQAHRAIQAGDGDVFVAGGVENMTRAPWVLSKSGQAFGSDAKLYDSSFGWRFVNERLDALYGTDAMGETAENLVAMYGISREDQDSFAYRSQQRAGQAAAAGRLAQEIVGVQVPAGRKGEAAVFFDRDEFMKPDSSLEGLSVLRPAFRKGGTVTAGNSSGLNDGAAAMLVVSEAAVKAHGFVPQARIVSSQVVGVLPRIMGIAPVEAGRKALEKAGLQMGQMDVIEVNEAFAAQVLAVVRQWKMGDDDPRLNPNGGAIALGHPLGMSGTRILQAAVNELGRRNGKYALCSMCVGVGQGYAVVLERV